MGDCSSWLSRGDDLTGVEMKVTIKLFGTYRIAVGRKQFELTLDETATVGTLLATLFEKYPKLSTFKQSIICSVNREYADEKVVLTDNDEVGILPPVSGG